MNRKERGARSGPRGQDAWRRSERASSVEALQGNRKGGGARKRPARGERKSRLEPGAGGTSHHNGAKACGKVKETKRAGARRCARGKKAGEAAPAVGMYNVSGEV